MKYFQVCFWKNLLKSVFWHKFKETGHFLGTKLIIRYVALGIFSSVFLRWKKKVGMFFHGKKSPCFCVNNYVKITNNILCFWKKIYYYYIWVTQSLVADDAIYLDSIYRVIFAVVKMHLLENVQVLLTLHWKCHLPKWNEPELPPCWNQTRPIWV